MNVDLSMTIEDRLIVSTSTSTSNVIRYQESACKNFFPKLELFVVDRSIETTERYFPR